MTRQKNSLIKSIFRVLIGVSFGINVWTPCFAADEKEIEIAALSYSPATLERRRQVGNAYDERLQGWVTIDVTVAADGAWKESRLMTSTGNKRLEKFALEAFEGSKWKPATVNGSPVESHELQFFSMNSDGQAMPRQEFVSGYKKISQAAADGDKELATKELGIIRYANPKASAEFVLLYLSEYEIAKKWGTLDEQFDAIQKIADGGQRAFSNLSQNLLEYYAIERFRSLLAQNRYGEAVRLSKSIMKFSIPESTKAQIQALVGKIEESRSKSVASEARIKLNESGYGYFTLLKGDSFLIKDGISNVRELRMRCGGRSLLINIDDNMVYRIKSDIKDCTIQAFGEPNSRLTIFEP